MLLAGTLAGPGHLQAAEYTGFREETEASGESFEEVYTYLAGAEDIHRPCPEQIVQQGIFYRMEEVVYDAVPLTDTLITVSGNMRRTEEYIPEPVLEQDGISYVLQNTRQEEWVESGRTRSVTVTRTFLKGQEIPETIDTETKDTVTGETIQVTVPRTEVQEDGAGWQQGGLELPVTYLNYENGTGAYEIGGQMVSLIEDTPAFENYNEAILAQNHLDPAFHRITDIGWEGDAYTNADGVLCRNAKAVGDVLVPRYRAVYQGDAAMPDLPMVRYINYYQSEADGYLVTARASYRRAEQEEDTSEKTLLPPEAVMILLEVLTGIILAAVLLLAVRERAKK